MLAHSERIETNFLKQFALLFVLILGTLVAAILSAIIGERQPAPNSPPSLAMVYDPTVEIRTSGVVQDTRVFACSWEDSQRGAHLLLRRGNDILEVHLADADYLRTHNIGFSQGEEVTVVGMNIESADFSAIVARQVVRARRAYSFRDPRGRPLWTKQ